MRFKNLVPIFIVCGTFSLWLLSCCSNRATISVQETTVEMRKNPFGIDVQNPRLSWQLSAEVNNVTQTAYQILVADSPKKLKSEKDYLWNTGKVMSDKSILISYNGKKLESGKTYFFKVRVWTNKGATRWSELSQWTMAFLDSSDWKARWIGLDSLTNEGENVKNVYTRLAARYLRKEFDLNSEVKNAKLFISGLGLYECYLNGKKVSSEIMRPTPTDYSKHVNYNVYDITSLLQKSTNTIGVVLGNGRYFAMRGKTDDPWYGLPPTTHYGFPKLLLQVEIEYKNGKKERVISDISWKITTKGPIIANNEYDGEEYDANRELPGWNINGYDDSDCINAKLVKAPTGKLIAQRNPNIVTMEEIIPASIHELDGKYIVDMGQNMVGWLAVHLQGKKNIPVIMRFSEKLNDDGTLYRENLRSAKATNVYIPAADGEFFWSPIFTYQGFRYVEISGVSQKPDLENVVGKVNYDKMKTIGHFETSDTTINQIFLNACWSIKGNYRVFPTDCPQRDERMPWLGDRATGCFGESFIFDNALLYEKWLQDIADSQKENGSLPDVAPAYWPFYSDNVTWPAVFIRVAQMLYEHSADTGPLELYYPAMKKWMVLLLSSHPKLQTKVFPRFFSQ